MKIKEVKLLKGCQAYKDGIFACSPCVRDENVFREVVWCEVSFSSLPEQLSPLSLIPCSSLVLWECVWPWVWDPVCSQHRNKIKSSKGESRRAGPDSVQAGKVPGVCSFISGGFSSSSHHPREALEPPRQQNSVVTFSICHHLEDKEEKNTSGEQGVSWV